MWKKQENSVGTQPESASKQPPESTLESDDEALMRIYRDHLAEKGKLSIGSQVSTEVQDQPSSPVTMERYKEAVNEFTKNATAFIEHLPLLTKARDAYEQAMRASAELRKVLDSREKILQTMMTKMEQEVNIHQAKPAPDKKKPEPIKVEAIRGSDEGVKWLP
jgi:exonuclease VII small subunit